MTSLFVVLSLTISPSFSPADDTAICIKAQNEDRCILDTHGLVQDILASQSSLRDEDGVRTYLKCRFEDERSAINDSKKDEIKKLEEKRAAFKATYNAALRKAANAFGLPYPLLACMHYIETEFNAKKKNGDGLGLGQLEPSGVAAINKAINQEEVTVGKLEKHREDFAKDQYQLKKLGAKGHADELASIDAQIETAKSNVSLKRMWHKFYGGKHNAPSTFENDDRLKPERAIAASALYLRRILSRNDYSNEELRKKDPDQAGLERIQAGVAAYNLGPNGFTTLFHQNGRRMDKTLAAIKGTKYNQHTPCHITKLNQCMLKSNKEGECPFGCKE